MDNEKNIVRLREKKLMNGASSLYLDIYKDGVRRYEFLKIYLNPGKDPATKAANRASIQAAQMIQAKRLVEIQSSGAGITPRKKDIRFVDFFNSYVESKINVRHQFVAHSNSVLNRWIAYAGRDVLLRDITPEMLLGFIKYLRNIHGYPKTRSVKLLDGSVIKSQEAEALVREYRFTRNMSYADIERATGIQQGTIAAIAGRMKKSKPMKFSETSVDNYFSRVASVLRKAHSKGLINTNPLNDIEKADKPRSAPKERSFLTMSEVQALVETPAENDTLKKMFLFGCFTGLRISDIKRLTWVNIDDTRISLTQKKTGNPVYIPLSNNAKNCLPERNGAKLNEPVFVGYPPYTRTTDYLKQWCKAAGIEKYITFHSSRHTFATLSLSYGADLYTISNLLGHTNINTTAIYAKIVDSKKIEAVNRIPEI